jgi:hypothetical protein
LNTSTWAKVATSAAVAMVSSGILLSLEPAKAADILFEGTLTGQCTITPGTSGDFAVVATDNYTTLSTANSGGAPALVSASTTTPGIGGLVGPRLNFVVPVDLTTRGTGAPVTSSATVAVEGATPATSTSAAAPLVLPFAVDATTINAKPVNLSFAAATPWTSGAYSATVVVTCLGET